MFTGAHNYLTAPQKICCNCKISKSIYELYSCGKCAGDLCVPCMKKIKENVTCKCSKLGHPTLHCNHYMICQNCYEKERVICCGKSQNKYCKSRYFGYCDDCFESRLLYLAEQEDISDVARGYLMYVIKCQLEKQADRYSFSTGDGNIMTELTDLYDNYITHTNTYKLFNFTNEDKLSSYIWNGYITEDVKSLTKTELYIMEIVLKHYMQHILLLEKRVTYNIQVIYTNIVKELNTVLS
jgi:hypothetical protein